MANSSNVTLNTVRKSSVIISSGLKFSIKALKQVIKKKKCIFILADQTFLSDGEYLMSFTDKLKSALGSSAKVNLEMVPSGESIKSFSAIESLSSRLIDMSKGYSRDEITLIAVGGGSIGDAVGFLASVLKRGVQLIHVPTTYLAAIDSSHGGKTAINVGGYKNQLGTFYPSELTLIDQGFFKTLSRSQQISSLGELYKIAVISGGALWKAWLVSQICESAKLESDELSKKIWKLLPLAIAAKLTIVKKDFEETLGHRLQLNLGHTLGHAIEATVGLPHGDAVLVGCAFSLNLSLRLKVLSKNDFAKMHSALPQNEVLISQLGASVDTLMAAMAHDKKATKADHVQFVLVKRPGQVLIKKLSFKQVQAALEDFLKLNLQKSNQQIEASYEL